MSDAEELAKLDLRLRRKQVRWEDGRAIAMIDPRRCDFHRASDGTLTCSR